MKPIDKLIEKLEKLDGAKNGYGLYSINELADWLTHDFSNVMDLAYDIKNESEVVK